MSLMETITEGQISFNLSDEEEKRVFEDPVVSIFFFAVCLVLGIASRHLLRGSKVPYTVALLVIGIALGSLEYGTDHRLGKLGAGIRMWAKIDPDLLLAAFLPALLFESSFSMEVHQIKRCMVQMFLLAGPGVLISTFILGASLKLAFPYDWDWKTSLLLGGILSATDPVAVVASLKEMGASKKLSTIIEGESLMNDGLAVVVYQLLYRMVLGQSFSNGAIIKYFLQVSIGAVGIGLAFGVASFLWLGFIFNDILIEIAMTLAVSYAAYFTAQDGVDVSGILTVMTLGVFYSAVARIAFKSDGYQSLHHFWEMVAYIANTLIFILSGVIIAEGILSNKDYIKKHEISWGYLILLYVFVQVTRAIVVGLFYPCLRYFGSGLNWKEATIVTWSGLRGPVALSLALSVKHTSDNSPFLSRDTGTLFVFFAGGIVFLTLIVNGSTTEFILHFLHMDKLSEDSLSEAKRRALEYTKYEMMNKALGAFGGMGVDEELGPSDWLTVKRYLACLDNQEEEQMHPHSVSGSENKMDAMHLKDTRMRLLNGVQAAYREMLEEGRISQATANILIQSIQEAMGLVSHKPLCDWDGLEAHVQFPSYYRFLQMKLCPEKLVSYLMVETLESGCHICGAFLNAHRIARRQLNDLLGESETAVLVINESEAEGEEARKFLEDVRGIFPQVLRIVKTRQMTYSILKQLSSYVENVEKFGLLDAKDISHLHDAVQTDLKKLLRTPPLVKLPNTNDIFLGHPFLGALPSIVLNPLKACTKELTKPHGVTLYKEGSKPNGIWLISNGLVKWTSESLKSKHSLHPIFPHGSCLGLYEVLTGKPYMCSIITSSLVQCFYIEADNVLKLLRSDPMVDSFLWQESVIILAKLILPQVFEEMSLPELRALLVERSTMKVYENEETIEIPDESVGFVLEGISSPAVLLPRCNYLVERKHTRVIVFDMDQSVVQKQSASWISHSVDLPKEHSGLMSWPERFYKPRRGRVGHQPDILSARALQISIFGCMVYDINGSSRPVSVSRVVNSDDDLTVPFLDKEDVV